MTEPKKKLMKSGAEVFISYAHADERHCKRLKQQLTPLQRQGLITSWHDRMISAGTEWKDEINTHLNAAAIILLLVSPDFMASDYCYSKEMERAMERHEAGEARVIPVIVQPVLWEEALFGKLQVLPRNAKPVTSWANRNEAFLDIAKGILKAVKELQQNSEPV